jgi:hypothetical protein
VLNFAWLEDDIAIRQNHRRSRLARAALPSFDFLYAAVTPQRAILIFGPALEEGRELHS